VTIKQILGKVGAEYNSASKEFGKFHNPHEGIAIILEEYLELQAEVFRKTQLKAYMYKEAIHLAAMAVRFIHDLELEP
jgi:hypothetical protein